MVPGAEYNKFESHNSSTPLLIVFRIIWFWLGDFSKKNSFYPFDILRQTKIENYFVYDRSLHGKFGEEMKIKSLR